MSFFSKRFLKLLEQEENVEITDVEAMETQLEPETDTADFEVDAPVQSPEDMTKANNVAQAQELGSWIGQMEEFTNFLNSEGDSVQTKLHDAGCDTLFNKIAGAETKKIARVAMDLSSLIENLKGYMHSADTK
jgi:hypothetical protein